MARKKKLPPITPGEVLLEEFLRPLGVSQNKLGRDIGVPITRINEIVNGKRAITPDTALRLAGYFGTSLEVWLNLQQQFDLESARREHGDRIAKTVLPLGSATR